MIFMCVADHEKNMYIGLYNNFYLAFNSVMCVKHILDDIFFTSTDLKFKKK